jgi:hypothetical protein
LKTISERCAAAAFCAVDQEQMTNYVLIPFMEGAMFKAVIQEAAALTSLALFVGMIAIWSQVLGSL